MWHKHKVNRLTSMCPSQPPLLTPSTAVTVAVTTCFPKGLEVFYGNNTLMEKDDL